MKAILFDLDGTLVDSNEFHVDAWDKVFRAAGYVFSRQQLHDQIGKGGDNLVPDLIPHLSQAEVDRLRSGHGSAFKNDYLPQVRPFPGARDLLARCHQAGLAVVLATSASSEERDRYIDLLGVRDIVDASTTADDVEHTKPCPDIFNTARRKVGVVVSEALVIGDTPYDVAAARSAGIGTVAVRSGGFSDAQLSGAIAIYDDVAAILAEFEGSPIMQSVIERA